MRGIKKVTLASILTIFLIVNALAQNPIVVNYQGYLTDADGQALTSEQQITFLLYEQLEGGLDIWKETQTVTLENGLFNVLLGSADSTLAIEHLTGERYLAIQIGDDDELEPRMRLASVSHSVTATHAEGAYTLDSPGDGPADAVYVDNNGNVGIGKTDPQTELDINGDIIADNTMIKVFESTCSGVTFFDIPNLNGDLHKIYKIYFHGTLHTGETYLLAEPNGDGAANHYRTWQRYDADAAGWNSATWGFLMTRSWVSACDVNTEFTLFCESGRARFGQGKGLMWNTSDARTLMLNAWGIWGNTTDNITFIRISVKNVNGVAAGTFSGRFIVYAVNAR